MAEIEVLFPDSALEASGYLLYALGGLFLGSNFILPAAINGNLIGYIFVKKAAELDNADASDLIEQLDGQSLNLEEIYIPSPFPKKS